MRSEFEKLPEIDRVLNNHTYLFEDGWYRFNGSVNNTKIVYAMGFVNGAWYAFQERQKKIDAVLEFIDSDDLGHDARLGDFYRDIEELLK